MTTAEVVEGSDSQAQHDGPRSWGDIAVSLSGSIAQLAEDRRGDLAELRRMDPTDPDAAVFWRLLAPHDLLGNAAIESKWALILHGIALMTPTNSGNPQTAHDGYMPVGRALFLGGAAQRAQGFYSESRLNRLLTARGPMLRTLLARMFRMLAAGDVSFNWREMALYIRNEDYNEDAAEQGRRRIARNYYQAERRSSQQSET
jgi:CRISPR type I-E-associated protein CasB/Cse2